MKFKLYDKNNQLLGCGTIKYEPFDSFRNKVVIYVTITRVKTD
jgi:hypothetical protein